MTTGGNSELFVRFLDKEESDKKAIEYSLHGNYLPEAAPKRGWRRREAVKLVFWVIALAVIDTGMILYWLGGGRL